MSRVHSKMLLLVKIHKFSCWREVVKRRASSWPASFKPVVSQSIMASFVCRLSFCVAVTVAQLIVNILWVIFNWAGVAVSTAPPLCFLMHWKQSSNESSLSSPSAIGNQIKASSEKPVLCISTTAKSNSPFPSLCSDSSMTKVHLWFFSNGTIVVSCTSREVLKHFKRALSCSLHANILFASVHVWLERQKGSRSPENSGLRAQFARLLAC